MLLGILFYNQKKIPYEPFLETMIDENKTSPTPDILLFDNKLKQNKTITDDLDNRSFSDVIDFDLDRLL